jgi:hypothetical protein
MVLGGFHFSTGLRKISKAPVVIIKKRGLHSQRLPGLFIKMSNIRPQKKAVSLNPASSQLAAKTASRLAPKQLPAPLHPSLQSEIHRANAQSLDQARPQKFNIAD